ncbi:outer membrane protein assembly factor BamB family protein [Actinoallomurus acaciae]|uniref:PQQ-binding-like beta-propeller repeat protein n=1 Tax=Actinoallomurus acaciae TaxID=502577 RepID=A0ABV5YBT6_9ACTN
MRHDGAGAGPREATVAVVLVSVGVRRLLDDGISGPYGRFPGPVAAQAPVRTPQRVALSPEGPGGIQVYGGVAIGGFSLGGPHDGVRAVGIATGKTYWEYHGQKPAEPIGLDRATGDVYVDGNHELAKIDVRTGRILWSRPTPGYFPVEHAVVSGTGTLVVFNDLSWPDRDAGGEVTGIDPATGRTRWRSAYDCDAKDRTTAVVGGTLAMACGPTVGKVRGIDLATGEQRWSENLARLFPQKPHGDESDDFVVLDAGQSRVAITTRDGFDLLDAATGEILRRRVTKGELATAFSGGMWLSTCALGKTEGVCASDVDTGKRLWSSPFPGSPAGYSPGEPAEHGYAAVADGRVYSLSAIDTPRREVAQIVVSDLRTGKRLTYWSHDGLLRPYDSFTITDGVVVVHDGGLDRGDVALYADRPDLRRTHRLFAR